MIKLLEQQLMVDGIECLVQVNKHGSDNLIPTQAESPVIYSLYEDILGAVLGPKARLGIWWRIPWC